MADKSTDTAKRVPVWSVIGGIVALAALVFAAVSVYNVWMGAGEGNNWERLASSGFGIAVMGGILFYTGWSRSRK